MYIHSDSVLYDSYQCCSHLTASCVEPISTAKSWQRMPPLKQNLPKLPKKVLHDSAPKRNLTRAHSWFSTDSRYVFGEAPVLKRHSCINSLHGRCKYVGKFPKFRPLLMQSCWWPQHVYAQSLTNKKELRSQSRWNQHRHTPRWP